MKRFVACVTVLGIVFSILLAGCGSDDPANPGTPTPHPFSGSYRYVQMTGLPRNLIDPFRSETGVFDTVRKDSVTFDKATATQGGNTQGPLNPADRALELLDDRGVAFTDAANLTMTGRHTPDGSVAVLNGDPNDSYLGFLMAARHNPAPTQNDLEGKWSLVQFGAGQATAPQTGMVGIGAVGSVEIDGNGLVTWLDYHYNRGARFDPLPVIHVPTELVLDGDGGLLWRRTGMNLVYFMGGLSADGNLILMGSIAGFGGEGGIRILIRGGLVTELAPISGTYLTGGFTLLNYNSTLGPYPMYGEMAFGGSGIGTWDGQFPPPISAPVTMSFGVDSEGLVDVTVSNAPMLWGYSGPQGDYLVLTGPMQSVAVEPWFQAAVR